MFQLGLWYVYCIFVVEYIGIVPCVSTASLSLWTCHRADVVYYLV
jgi:hypothetical protein